MPEKTYTFYYQCFCHICKKTTDVPVSKKAADIPEPYREVVLARLNAGEKINWPYNPSEYEVRTLVTNLTCPQGHAHGYMDFVWPLGGG